MNAAEIVRKARMSSSNAAPEVPSVPSQKHPVAETPPHTMIKHVKKGDSFSGIYYVEKAHIKVARNNNKYTDFSLRDRSGSNFVRFWGTCDGVDKGCYVEITAIVDEYMGNPQIVASEITDVPVPKDLTNYLPKSETFDSDIAEFEKIKALISDMCKDAKDDFCSRVFETAFGENESSLFAKFTKAPFGVMPHYGVEGGCLSHSIKTTLIALKLSEDYALTIQEKVLLVTAGILHSVGAINAYSFEDCMPVQTKYGKLLGVGLLTNSLVSSILRGLSSKDEKGESHQANLESSLRLLHAIAAVKSETLKPMTKEAIILSEAFRTDMELVSAVDFIANDQNPNEEFTAYDTSMGRQYYRGNAE